MSKKDFSTKISGSMISYRDPRNCHMMTLKLQDVNVCDSMKGSDALTSKQNRPFSLISLSFLKGLRAQIGIYSSDSLGKLMDKSMLAPTGVHRISNIILNFFQ